MRKYDLYIGCNVDGKPEYRVDYVQFVCKQALEAQGFGGATFTEAVGLWEGIEERTVICTMCTDRDQGDIFAVVGMIRDHLRQESVMVIESEPMISFI